MAIRIVAPKAPSAIATKLLPPSVLPDFSMIQEQFPRIGAKIAELWGSVALQEYLNKTIFDERGGRQGFPLAVVSALMRIHEHHSAQVPSATAGVWDHIA